jgi:hypothetical protein
VRYPTPLDKALFDIRPAPGELVEGGANPDPSDPARALIVARSAAKWWLK